MSISAKIGCPAHTLNQWVKKAEAGSGKRAGIPAEVADRLKVLERENRELRQGEEDQETVRGSAGRSASAANPPVEDLRAGRAEPSPANEIPRKASAPICRSDPWPGGSALRRRSSTAR